VRLTFVTGWAGYPEQFPLISREATVFTPFIEHGEEEILSALAAGEGDLLAWSTGAHMVLKHCDAILPRYARIVLAAPFLRFTDHVPERLLVRMIRGMERDPQKTLAAFYANCAEQTPPAFRPGHAPALLAGLEYLRVSEVNLLEPLEAHAAERVVLLHGNKDRIVPPAASEELLPRLPGATLHIANSGHKIAEALMLEHFS